MMTILSMENNNSSSCLCFGCGTKILDRWLLCVSPDLQWHTSCLKCHECGSQLDEKCTCFMRNGKAFCKPDFIRLYGNNICCKCKQNIGKLDYVMKVNSKIFHVDCFRCDACARALVRGEHFTILKEETILCKTDFEQQLDLAASELNFNKQNCRASTPMSTTLVSLPQQQQSSQQHTQGFGGLVSGLMAPNCDSNLMNSDLNSSNCSSVSPNSNSNSSSGDFGNTNSHMPTLHHLNNQGHLSNLDQTIDGSQQVNGSNSFSSQSNLHLNGQSHLNQSSLPSQPISSSGRHSRNPDQPKQTRVRTVLNDKQLSTLRSTYQMNPRPDALTKDQLVTQTGLSPRVIRVWFQNKRCKDKKKNTQIQRQAQMEKDGRQMQNIASMRGVPLVAMSPVPHDSPAAQSYCSDIHVYEPNWPKFADCAIQQHGLDRSDPNFQHLVSQMHGYDTKEQKWTPQCLIGGATTPTGHPLPINQPNHHLLNNNLSNETQINPVSSTTDSKSGIQLINSTDCSSNGSILMNGSNSNNATTLINPLINSGNGISILNNLTNFESNDLRRPESVLSAALRSDTPSDLSGTSD